MHAVALVYITVAQWDMTILSARMYHCCVFCFSRHHARMLYTPVSVYRIKAGEGNLLASRGFLSQENGQRTMMLGMNRPPGMASPPSSAMYTVQDAHNMINDLHRCTIQAPACLA